MRQRGRKSSAGLSVVPISCDRQRPEPPAQLTAEQATIWRSIVETTPAGWFAPGDLMLELYCRHAATSNWLSKRIDALDFETVELKLLDRLLRMRERESKMITHLATKMRLTQQAKMHPRTAGRAATDLSLHSKPWEDV